MLGTIINAGAVIVGSLLGLLIHSRLPKKIVSISFHAIGLFTLLLGVSMALKTTNFLIMIFSIVLGSIIGELIDIDRYIGKLSEYLKRKIKSDNKKFTDGFVTAFLLFCMGSMTILGSIEEGLGNAPRLLLAKSVLDGFASMALASSLGIGVLFSVIPLFLFQGALTISASLMGDFLSNTIITELSAVGGLLLMGLSLNILEIKNIKVSNMLPSLIVVVILTLIFL